MTHDRLSIIDDIKAHPEKHHHAYDALLACCLIDGAVDCGVLQAHSEFAPLGENAGVDCDVRSGPCACGAWHEG